MDFQYTANFFDSSSDESSDDEDDFLMDDSGDEMVVQQCFKLFIGTRISIENYMENVVNKYTEVEFKTHFRISRSLFNTLSVKYSESEAFLSLREDKRLSFEMHLAIFLWFAGHEAVSYRDISDRFNVLIYQRCIVIKRMIYFISSLSPEIIKWPTEDKKRATCDFFKNKNGFSKTIGCIDGTHVIIDPPKNSKNDYIDRKGNVSVCLQAICNEKKKFINTFVSYPGSSHDSWVFQNSPIHENLNNYCEDYYILGDSAYPCTKHVVTPYRDNGHLTIAQKQFNMKLSSGRVSIEHSFGMLKQRFRQLYYCKLRGMKKIYHFISTCCVLHNIANEDDLEFLVEEDINVENDESDEIHGEALRGNAVRDLISLELQTQN